MHKKNEDEEVYVAPFSIKILEQDYPFFEYLYKNIYVYMRYELKATIERDYTTLFNYESYLLILSKPIIRKEINLFKEVKKNIKNYFLFDKGEVLFKVFLYDLNFKYGSDSELLIDIDNTKGKLATEEYKIVIKRKLNFSEFYYGKHHENEKEIVILKEKAKVNPGESKNFKCKFKIEDKDNDIYNKDLYLYKDIPDVNFFMPTILHDVFKCEYEIKISLYFENFVYSEHRPSVIFPINVVHETLKEYMNRLGIKNDPENSQEQIAMIGNTPNDNSEQSITPGNTTNELSKEDTSTSQTTISENIIDKTSIDDNNTIDKGYSINEINSSTNIESNGEYHSENEKKEESNNKALSGVDNQNGNINNNK